MRKLMGLPVLLCGMVAIGCGSGEKPTPLQLTKPKPTGVKGSSANTSQSWDDIRDALKAKSPENIHFVDTGGEITQVILTDAGVKSLEPLKGLKLKQLMIEGNPVEDLSPLKGMPIEVLYLDRTMVKDLSPLKGMKLSKLNLQNTPVADISPLADVELTGTIWLINTAITDLTALTGQKLESIDIEGTAVSDLTPISEMKSLLRLNIASTKVGDLAPLKNLNLNRLILTPEVITKGWNELRAMTSLTGIGKSLNEANRQRPAAFWDRFDQGVFHPRVDP